MLRPAMSQIIGKRDSYYKFVVSVAKRARDIAIEAEENKIILEEKPVKLAVTEFATGKCKSDYSQH
ncbi:MAG: DNA-directed RNA polymerase subunit omega [Oscillospiraceae bacterium]